jgi:uncharacterized protein (TIGR00299 family) protein
VTRVAWWHPFAGIAGDMALGSLLDAGADLAVVRAGLAQLPLTGWQLEAQAVLRNGLAATHARVTVDETATERTWADIRTILDGAHGLPERARSRAHAVFALLADVEGALHGRPADEVHFHEVGGLDAIIDVLGTCLALESLGVDEVRTGPVAVGLGAVRAAHGTLPNPAPAVIELLRGLPVRGSDTGLELTTPTGAALLAVLAVETGPLPEMVVRAAGYGAGTRERPEVPNVVQVVVGELAPPAAGDGEALVVLEANVDDVTGETLGYVIERGLAAGALDAWVVPVVGKKGRPAQIASLLVREGDVGALVALLKAETGTLGVRATAARRWASSRHWVEVVLQGETVRVKVGPHRFKAEHEDVARAAIRLALPAREVALRAEAEARLLGT